MKEPIEFPLKKKRMLAYASGAMAFVIAGIFMISAALLGNGHLLAKIVFFTVGLSAVLFFGLLALMLVSKILGKKAGLVITDEGFYDNSSAVAAGFIAWKDVRKINFSHSAGNAFLAVLLKKPEQYIARQTNPIKRLAMKMNQRIAGTPIHISVSFLHTDLYSLNALMAEKRFQKKTAAGEA